MPRRRVSHPTVVLALLAAQVGSALPGAPPVVHESATDCLVRQRPNRFNEHNHYSQDYADGVLETIFGCIKTDDKFYVEFGCETGAQTNTRYLRQHLGWSGLMMDGSFDNPGTNLQREIITERNIVGLFQKYNVPFPRFDLLSTDIDLNTFWVLLSILRNGYRPRVIITEVNNNFLPGQAYVVTSGRPDAWGDWDDGEFQWGKDCFYGASAEAYRRMLASFNYVPVWTVLGGNNMIFVHSSALPKPLGWGIEDTAVPWDFSSYHLPCSNTLWLHVPEDVDWSSDFFHKGLLTPTVLRHQKADMPKYSGKWVHSDHNLSYFKFHLTMQGVAINERRRGLVPVTADAELHLAPCSVDAAATCSMNQSSIPVYDVKSSCAQSTSSASNALSSGLVAMAAGSTALAYVGMAVCLGCAVYLFLKGPMGRRELSKEAHVL